MKSHLHSTHLKNKRALRRPAAPSNCHLLVFAKAPIPGMVKTRLIPSLGAQGAARLYESMALHCLAAAVNSRVGPVDLWCTPSTGHPFFKRCAEDFHVFLHPQTQGDIGSRMAHAFQVTLKISASALLLGTDCPSVTQDDLVAAAAVLQRGTDAVIVPTEDGGYSLLGLRRYTPDLFTGIAWGSESVLEQTRTRLSGLAWSWHELPERWDVDRPEDVERLKSEGYLLSEIEEWGVREMGGGHSTGGEEMGK